MAIAPTASGLKDIENPVINCLQCNLSINKEAVKVALHHPTETYSRIRALVLNASAKIECHAMVKDHYREDLTCHLAVHAGYLAATHLHGSSFKNPPTVKSLGEIVVIDDSYCTLMSAFAKKENQENGYSDLTGDSGQLIFNALINRDLHSKFVAVYDIGAQDIDFVKRFPNPIKRYVLDINILTPFLQAEELSVKYLIGDAQILLKDRGIKCLSPPLEEGRRLFAMSNFFNVLSPSKGWEILKLIPNRMRVGDILAITNISDKHFPERNKVAAEKGKTPSYLQDEELLGLIHFKRFSERNKLWEHYKTTIKTDTFIKVFKQKFSSFYCCHYEEKFLKCHVKNEEYTDVLFTTIIFTYNYRNLSRPAKKRLYSELAEEKPN